MSYTDDPRFEGTSGLHPDAAALGIEFTAGKSIGTKATTGERCGSAFRIETGHHAVTVNVSDPRIRSFTDVVASVGEFINGGIPFIGLAGMQVWMVAPFDGGVLVRVFIDWDRPLRFQVMAVFPVE